MEKMNPDRLTPDTRRWVTCPDCKGSGKASNGSKCRTCIDGRIPAK